MGYLQGGYLIASGILVLFMYRGSLRAVVLKGEWRSLWRPILVLGVAYLAGLNVPAIATSLSSFFAPSTMEPLFYITTLIALIGIASLPPLRPAQIDRDKLAE